MPLEEEELHQNTLQNIHVQFINVLTIDNFFLLHSLTFDSVHILILFSS